MRSSSLVDISEAFTFPKTGKAIIPSAKKQGGPGTAIDVPLHYKDEAFVRTHFDAMEVRLADAPKANEILVALVVTDGGRPHPRIGGLTVDEVVNKDAAPR